MLGPVLRAAIITIAASFAGEAMADDPPQPARIDVTQLETSARLRLNWSEIAFRGPRPKAWDSVIAPEFRVSLRILEGLFEGKIEVGVASDHFAHFSDNNVDILRGEMQLGVNTGAWSYLLEWKARDVFEPGFDDFNVGLNTYDARVRHRFAAKLFDDLPAGLFQFSVAGGYVAGTPEFFARYFAELELEAVQRFGGGYAIMIAPKLEISDFLAFPGGDRDDAVLSLRVVPSVALGDGLTISVEGQATVSFSTLANKAGETWEVTPIVRLQKAL